MKQISKYSSGGIVIVYYVIWNNFNKSVFPIWSDQKTLYYIFEHRDHRHNSSIPLRLRQAVPSAFMDFPSTV